MTRNLVTMKAFTTIRYADEGSGAPVVRFVVRGARCNSALERHGGVLQADRAVLSAAIR